jgi:hypothetical protein
MGLSFLALSLGAVLATAQEGISVERGEYISIIGGCHDCHTEGYSEARGKIDPSKAMKAIR